MTMHCKHYAFDNGILKTAVVRINQEIIFSWLNTCIQLFEEKVVRKIDKVHVTISKSNLGTW